MLSYIHAYHAGNHADILKHVTLSLALEHLCKKDKPFVIIDSHAGSGLYNLDDERSLKTGESLSGVEKIIMNEESDNRCLEATAGKTFLSLIQKYYSKNQYPGSPLIENYFLRPGDEQILSELHPTAFSELKNCFYERRKECEMSGTNFVEPAIHKRDGYELLKAVTPPKIKRGLCLIDPSFEDKSDFEKCSDVISSVHKKWSSGIIALWYPLIEHRTVEISMMKEKIAGSVTSSEPKILDVQLEIKKKEEMTGLSSLYGSGMFIVNFPYKLDEQLKEIMPLLSEQLGESSKEWSVDLL